MRKSARSSGKPTIRRRRGPGSVLPPFDLGLAVIVVIWVGALAGTGLLVWMLVGR